MGEAVRSTSAPSKKRKKDDKKVKEKTTAERGDEFKDLPGGSEYKPTTPQTSASYSSLLSHLRQSLGSSMSLEIVVDAAMEILEIVLDADGDIRTMESTVNEVLTGSKGPFPDSSLWDKIKGSALGCSDYVRAADRMEADKSAEDGGMNEEGVAVVFDSDDEEGENEDGEDGNLNDTILASDSESEEEEEGNMVTAKAKEGMEGGEGDDRINPLDIDEHYIQRMLLPHYSNDSNVTAKIASGVLANLEVGDERETENKLVVLLGFDKFEVVKKLMKNRWRLVFCTQLKKVEEDTAAKDELLTKIANHAHGLDVLSELNEKQDVKGLDKRKISDRLRQAQEEAKKLRSINEDKGGKKDVTDMDVADASPEEGRKSKNNSSAGGLQNLDLESLAFKEGSRTMTNESCKLPDKSWRVTKPGYEEVHVPAIRNVPGEGEKFVEITKVRGGGGGSAGKERTMEGGNEGR